MAARGYGGGSSLNGGVDAGAATPFLQSLVRDVLPRMRGPKCFPVAESLHRVVAPDKQTTKPLMELRPQTMLRANDE